MMDYRRSLLAGFNGIGPFFSSVTGLVWIAKPIWLAELFRLPEPEADRRDSFLPTIITDLNYPVVDFSAVRDAPVVFVINKFAHSH